jgi:hypothetical protein
MEEIPMFKKKNKKAKKAITIGGIVMGIIGWVMAIIFANEYDKTAVESSRYRAKAIRFAGTLKRKKELIQADTWTLDYDKEACDEAEIFYDGDCTV